MCNPLEELQEKAIRLQQENKMLPVQQEEMHKDRLTEFQSVPTGTRTNWRMKTGQQGELEICQKHMNILGSSVLKNGQFNRRTSSTLNFLNYAIFGVKRNGTWSKN
uniref:protein Hook homolog 1-like n=1 Tax=Pristiophorus japonicus TaxID=55135 RepID=UPI00398EA679